MNACTISRTRNTETLGPRWCPNENHRYRDARFCDCHFGGRARAEMGCPPDRRRPSRYAGGPVAPLGDFGGTGQPYPTIFNTGVATALDRATLAAQKTGIVDPADRVLPW